MKTKQGGRQQARGGPGPCPSGRHQGMTTPQKQHQKAGPGPMGVRKEAGKHKGGGGKPGGKQQGKQQGKQPGKQQGKQQGKQPQAGGSGGGAAGSQAGAASRQAAARALTQGSGLSAASLSALLDETVGELQDRNIRLRKDRPPAPAQLAPGSPQPSGASMLPAAPAPTPVAAARGPDAAAVLDSLSGWGL
ncbi:hypothetical protein HYH03_011280 [Edaphochlamys debaryana]|uniref:Uncharacterized protein n=1 Tax=Edaphochlamys debaryana TaxID=47281 RepID=A0A836BV72_9CHLO|nr:hypothetical protein HYH03_011280 [Edaphochlamys debaryana]|eukprot:KAG2490331.1 hypothetical protein HYH03_011280 [Edaphochlamys debaryana]